MSRELYAVIVEGNVQDPILMETEGPGMSLTAAKRRLNDLCRSNQSMWFRGCIVRLQFEFGNRGVFEEAARQSDDTDNQEVSF